MTDRTELARLTRRLELVNELLAQVAEAPEVAAPEENDNR